MSSIDLIATYLRQRVRLTALIPLALLLALPGSRHLSAFAVSAAQAFLLVLAFRIWDDIEDRERDARDHPERVTVTAKSVTPLVALAVILVLVAAPRTTDRLAVLGLAVVTLFAWYRLRGSARGLLAGHVVLLKYPAIAFAVASTRPSAASLASVYLALCVFESFDDPTLRGSATARRVAFAELALVPILIASQTLFGGGFA